MARSRDQRWGDDEKRAVLEQVAADISARTGGASCAIVVVGQDGHREVVATAGDPGDDDVLELPVHDGEGELRAVVRLGPAGGSEPSGPARRDQVVEAVRLPMRTLLTVVEHESFAQRVRMMGVVRRLLHTADARHDEDTLVGRAVEELSETFEATAFEIHVFDRDWAGPLSPSLAPEHRRALVEAAERACAAHCVVVLERGEVWADDELRGIEPALTRMVADADASSVVLVPVGAAGTAMGLMLVARARDGRPWTEAESEAALDFGHDLGRTLVNARVTQRERDLADRLHWHEELRRSFVSTITHELKTPLTIIRANAELLAMEGELSPSVTHRLEAIERGVTRMVGMVNDLTTLAKVTALAQGQVRITVDLATLLQEVLLALEAVAHRAGVLLERGEEPGSPFLMTGDPDELSSALTNIVENAVKYSDPGGRVRLSLCREGDSLVIICTDEGLGISEEDQAALFTPFFRSSNPYAIARPGTGLGLDIVKGVVQRHSGQVTVESELGEGTTVRLSFPALVEPPA